MARSTDELHVAAWVADGLPNAIRVTRFTVTPTAHDTLAQWCEERAGKATYSNVVLAGLPEILAFLVPEAAYMDVTPGQEGGPRRLTVTFLGDVSADHALRGRMEAAINVWLGIIYADKPAGARAAVAASARADAGWRVTEVPTRMKEHAGICAVPQDGMLFNALVSHAVGSLAGQAIRFASGEARTLVRQTSQSSPFNGIELVAFPPRQDPNGGLYTEVVTLKAANFPERKGMGLHLLARPSIRNWGSVKGYDLMRDPARSLDVFMPSEDGPPGPAGLRHMSFAYKAVVDNWGAVHERDAQKQIVARWESHREQRVFDLLRRLVGGAKLADADLTRPALGQEGLWVLPRLAPGNGDRYLAGGSGVGWPDRIDIAQSLDEPLRALGLVRAGTMRRVKGQMPVSGPFHGVPKERREEAPTARRQALLRTLAALDNGRHLDLVVFHVRDETPEDVRQEVEKLLGAPDRRDGLRLVWEDGLTVRLLSAPAGPLAEALTKATLSVRDGQNRTDKQKREILRARQDAENEKATRRMHDHVAITRGSATGVACAILEMPASLRDDPARDPYALARRELAGQRMLPQVVLHSEDMSEQKYRASVADWVRMLGVIPVHDGRLDLAPAALTVIQRNEQQVGGGTLATQTFPLAARIREGVLECAVPSEGDGPDWKPYALTALGIFSGSYGRFGRNRGEENMARYGHFFSEALEQIDRAGETLVILDGDVLAKFIRPLQNGRLTFDALQVGQDFRPSDLPNTRMVRFVADGAKLPTYYHLDETEWPQGLFSWEGARRTAYGIKRKPASAKTVGRAALVSRHGESGDNRARPSEPRRLAAMDEICALFLQPGDNPADVTLLTHRLRTVHVQYGDDTRLPFPLHELRLLGKAVTA